MTASRSKWGQAIGSDYHLRLSTIKRDSQLLNRKRLVDNIMVVEDALDDLVEAGVLHDYRVEKQVRGKRVMDATFTLRASMRLIDDAKAANKRASEGRDALRALDLLPK